MGRRTVLCSAGLLAALVLSVSCASPAPAPTSTQGAQTEEATPTQAATPTAADTPTVTPLASLTPVRTPPTGGLYVDVTQVQGEISPLVYGTNYGPWLFVPLEMQPAAEDANLNVIRYPGGNWGDRNDLDEWTLDQYIAFCRQVGAEPYIHVRLLDGTAEKAAEMVRLMNVEKGYGVKYWTIGNEPNLFGDGYEVEQYNREWRQWATAMRAVDPTIQLIGPEVNQFFANPTDDYQLNLEHWMVEFLKANGDMVDIVSFHRYPFPPSINSGPPEPDALRNASIEWDELIPYVRALAREHTGRDLPVAVTEANSSWSATSGTDTSMDSHLNAIWWGDSLGRMIRQGTFMVAQFAIIGDFGLMGRFEVKPIYYVYQMYKQFGETLVYAASENPDVSIFAAQRADGTLTLMIINRSASETTETLTLEGSTAEFSEAWLFDAAHPAESVDPASLVDGDTVRLPAESMVLLAISPSE